MLFDLPSLMHSLCLFIVDQVGDGSIVYAPGSSKPRNLWRNKAAQDKPGAAVKFCDDPFTVLRMSGGEGTVKHPKPIQSVQIKTVGSNDDAAWRQATEVYEAVALAPDGQPLRAITFDWLDAQTNDYRGQWQIVNVDTLNRPGQLGREADTGRVEIVSNVQIGFYPVSE